MPPSHPPATARSGPGRPKSASKRQAILEAAKHLFLQAGFEGTSVDHIAAEAGVSKLTIYNHFGDKEGLFFAAVEAGCREQLPDDLFTTPPNAPVQQALHDIGCRLHALFSSADALALHRMMVSDPRHVERLGPLFWNAGPARLIDSLDTFLQAAIARGELRIENTRQAASHFLFLIKGEINLHMLCGPIASQHGNDTHTQITAAVDFFLRAYGV